MHMFCHIRAPQKRSLPKKRPACHQLATRLPHACQLLAKRLLSTAASKVRHNFFHCVYVTQNWKQTDQYVFGYFVTGVRLANRRLLRQCCAQASKGNERTLSTNLLLSDSDRCRFSLTLAACIHPVGISVVGSSILQTSSG